MQRALVYARGRLLGTRVLPSAPVSCLHASAASSTAHGHAHPHAHTGVAGDAPVLFIRRGRAKEIILNRPKALNSLNLPMVRLMNERLAELTGNSDTSVIILKGAGGKAFCAGGDIKSLCENRGSAETAAAQEAFFREEYTLDYRLALSNDSKPHVAIYDGTVMGGGVGVSINARFRVASEKALFAMPETGIGLFPDVGGSYFLPRLPRNLGTFLALTGHRLKGADLVHSGVATHFVDSSRLPALEDALSHLPSGLSAGEAPAAVAEVLAAHSAPLPARTLGEAEAALIERCFGKPTVESILAALHEEGAALGAPAAPFAASLASTLSRMSPTSLKVTLEQLHRGQRSSLAQCFAMELRMALACMKGHDFFEGVRALLVDRDNKPKWSPASLAGVTREMVEAHFAPLGDGREWSTPAL